MLYNYTHVATVDVKWLMINSLALKDIFKIPRVNIVKTMLKPWMPQILGMCRRSSFRHFPVMFSQWYLMLFCVI